jgi:hypothetical protein
MKIGDSKHQNLVFNAIWILVTILKTNLGHSNETLGYTLEKTPQSTAKKNLIPIDFLRRSFTFSLLDLLVQMIRNFVELLNARYLKTEHR